MKQGKVICDIKEHIKVLGFKDTSDYSKWCIQQGFKKSLNKTPKDMDREIYFMRGSNSERVLLERKVFKKGIPHLIKVLREGLSVPRYFYEDISNYYNKLATEKRADYLLFLEHLNKTSKLLEDEKDSDTVLRVLRVYSYNSFFIRNIKDWEPKSHNNLKQFSSLIRYLFTNYSIPLFMDSAWHDKADLPLEWFFEICWGNNIRKCTKLPFQVTKRMAHLFMCAPDHLEFLSALRYARVTSLDGDYRLFKELEGTRLTFWKDEDFAVSVIKFFADNPMLDRVHVGPIIDYIQNIKFTPVDVFREGVMVSQGPQKPNFSMSNRSPNALLEVVESWHKLLNNEKKAADTTKWESAKIPDFMLSEGKEGTANNKIWRISELLSSAELKAEGRAMSHCVASYSNSCKSRTSGIWSLTSESFCNVTSMVTIEINLKSKEIVQARGKRNRKPEEKEWQMILKWAGLNKLSVASYFK